MSSSKILKETDEFLEIELTFNLNTNGHDFGSKKYNQNLYERMIESSSTKQRIANGYALGGYSHKHRNPSKLYQFDGDACIKTISMEWLGDGKVKHVERIIKTDIGKKIIILLKNGVGGFSSVHHLKTARFAGFDYVHYPMFASNKLVHDNACKNGVCNFSMDDVFSDAEKLVSDFMGNNGYSKEVEESIQYLEKKMLELDPTVKVVRELKIEYALLEKEKKLLEDEFKAFKESVSSKLKDVGLNQDWEVEVPKNLRFNFNTVIKDGKELERILSNGIRQNDPTSKVRIIK